MENLNRKLLFGYIFSKEYLGNLNDDDTYGYAFSQAILYLGLPFAFHISGIVSISIALFSKLFLTSKPQTLLFLVLVISFLMVSMLYSQYFRRKYPSSSFRSEVLDASRQQKRSALRFSMLFFVINVLIFVLVEIPLIFLV